MKIVKNVQPPAGLGRRLYRVPIYLYRAGLGWMFRDRLMLLHHIGRVSGKQRQALLANTRYRRPPPKDCDDDSYHASAGRSHAVA